MKQATKYLYLFFLSIGCIALLSSCKTSKETVEKTQNLVESGVFKFVANSAQPMSGRSINLTSTYDLKISKDTIIAYLPYFGIAYSGVMPGADNGIKFTSTNFELKKTRKNSNEWRFVIKTKDTSPHYDLYLNIGSGGYASLSVNQNNKQGITFSGVIE